jgi:hypothetical protein
LYLIKEAYFENIRVWIGLIAIILGILVLALPDLIRWFIGVGLIVLGVMALIRK